MTQQIDVPGVGLVDFPDTMSDEQITHAIKTNILPKYKTETKQEQTKQLPSKVTDYSLSDWGNLAKQAITQGNQAIAQGRPGRTPVVGPAIAAGAGELLKGAGAVGELFTDKAKPITELGQNITQGAKDVNEVAGTAGQVGSYVAPYGAALKGVRAVAPAIPGVRALAHPATSLGRAGEAALAAGAVGGLTTPGTMGERGEEALMQGAMGGAGELALPWLGGVAKGAYNQFKGIEAPRMYNVRSGKPDAGLPVGPGTNPNSIMMPPNVAQQFPNASSLPLPGTAGEQTGARLYNYATSLRPWLDLAGGASGVPFAGLAGEIPALSHIPGFKSQGLPEIGLKGASEALQSNKLQGITGQTGQGVGGTILNAGRQPEPVAAPVTPQSIPQPAPRPMPQAPVKSVAPSTALTVQGPGQNLPPSVIPMPGPQRNVNIEGESFKLPNEINTSNSQAASAKQKSMDAAAAKIQPVSPESIQQPPAPMPAQQAPATPAPEPASITVKAPKAKATAEEAGPYAGLTDEELNAKLDESKTNFENKKAEAQSTFEKVKSESIDPKLKEEHSNLLWEKSQIKKEIDAKPEVVKARAKLEESKTALNDAMNKERTSNRSGKSNAKAEIAIAENLHRQKVKEFKQLTSDKRLTDIDKRLDEINSLHDEAHANAYSHPDVQRLMGEQTPIKNEGELLAKEKAARLNKSISVKDGNTSKNVKLFPLTREVKSPIFDNKIDFTHIASDKSVLYGTLADGTPVTVHPGETGQLFGAQVFDATNPKAPKLIAEFSPNGKLQTFGEQLKTIDRNKKK